MSNNFDFCASDYNYGDALAELMFFVMNLPAHQRVSSYILKHGPSWFLNMAEPDQDELLCLAICNNIPIKEDIDEYRKNHCRPSR